MSPEEQPAIDESTTGDPSEGGSRAGPEEGAATPGEGAEPGQAPSGGAGSNIEKDPDDWATGGEPMTGAQSSYLRTLSEQAGVEFDESLNKAAASKRIDELQQRTGRGR
ncbi:MAG: DUF3072 domain-containing protein [Thermoleophilaceae bacterium]|nr:DUF3072 domain-containing protein [Thermoleophilaceae bacterium]